MINDITVLRATATFLRTTVTRNTAWDRFLAGNNGALTPAQRRGASLFFTSARSGGAGCYSCHSGPMLNKQVTDPDVAGVGQFVEENFYNLGLADHPLQALNAVGRNEPNFRDDGRREITARDSDAFKFRVLTLRQLKDARFFFHNGSFTSVKDVVQYFNAGLPQDAQAGAANTLTPRFTHPRGPGSRRGLGLSDDQVDDLTDFLENGLYDPAFVHFDPTSSTRMFELNPPDFLYSIYRPDLAALGAVDGRPASGRPQDNDDALSRRDMGLEFLDVTAQANIVLVDSSSGGGGRHRPARDAGLPDHEYQQRTHRHAPPGRGARTVLPNRDGERQWPNQCRRSLSPGVPAERDSGARSEHPRRAALPAASAIADGALYAHAAVGPGQPIGREIREVPSLGFVVTGLPRARGSAFEQGRGCVETCGDGQTERSWSTMAPRWYLEPHMQQRIRTAGVVQLGSAFDNEPAGRPRSSPTTVSCGLPRPTV